MNKQLEQRVAELEDIVRDLTNRLDALSVKPTTRRSAPRNEVTLAEGEVQCSRVHSRGRHKGLQCPNKGIHPANEDLIYCSSCAKTKEAQNNGVTIVKTSKSTKTPAKKLKIDRVRTSARAAVRREPEEDDYIDDDFDEEEDWDESN
jgi:hypothetical protein